MIKIIREDIYTAEFVKDRYGIEVEYNSKKMNLFTFLRLIKKGDTGAQHIVKALKDKMCEMGWKETIVDFIDHYFGGDNPIMDVVVIVKKDGSTIVKFDADEMKNGGQGL